MASKWQNGHDYVWRTSSKSDKKKSNSPQSQMEDIEYVIENGLINRRLTRDRNQQIVNKIEYVFQRKYCPP
jgi:hypothetical protein